MPELELRAKLERDRLPYCVATVIAVRGSASACAGSKMLISEKGENLWGWVGGGCAESFTREQALEALSERSPRIITADLDDEVFGLGMPCGGQMDIFLEPIFPPETLEFETGGKSLKALANHFGFEAKIKSLQELSPSDCVRRLAQAIAASRGATISCPEFGSPSEFLILGASRITEELAKLGALLGWPTRVYGLNLDARLYPSTVTALVARPDYEGLEVREGAFVIVASHHKGDHHYITEALRARAKYVGLVASRKRAQLVFDHLRQTGIREADLRKVRSPTGLDLRCRNPGEIALSITAELLGTLP